MSRRRTKGGTSGPDILRFPLFERTWSADADDRGGEILPESCEPRAPLLADGELFRRLDFIYGLMDTAPDAQRLLVELGAELRSELGPDDDPGLAFGKYRGLTFAQVADRDVGYLFWLRDNRVLKGGRHGRLVAFLAARTS